MKIEPIDTNRLPSEWDEYDSAAIGSLLDKVNELVGLVNRQQEQIDKLMASSQFEKVKPINT